MRGTSSGGAKIATLALALACATCNRLTDLSSDGAVSRIVVTPPAASIAITGTSSLRVSLFDADDNPLTGRAIEWRTTDATIATVTQTGLVTGVALGQVTISAVSEGRAGFAIITVVAGVPLVATQIVPSVTGLVNTPLTPVTPVIASGGTAPYTFALSGGTLPNGLLFSTSTGTISGTPTTALANTTFTVTATDNLGATSSATFTMQIDAVTFGIVLNVSASATATITGGQALTIPLLLDLTNRGTDDLASITVTLQWDASRFTFQSQADGNWPGGFVATNPAAGQIAISGFSATGATANFTLLTVTLASNATASTITTPITATISNARTQSNAVITIVPRNLTVTINP